MSATLKAVDRVILETVHDTVAKATVPAASAAAAPIAQAVIDKVEPMIEHASNSEPWFQSRVTLGSLAAIITSGFTLYGLLSAGITDGELLAPPVGAILGGALALYGRWVATRPIGR